MKGVNHLFYQTPFRIFGFVFSTMPKFSGFLLEYYELPAVRLGKIYHAILETCQKSKEMSK